MKMTAKLLAVWIFVILFGGILFTTAMGWWETKTTKEPAKFKEGEAAGQYNPADIRGSYLFGDINRVFGIPLDDLKIAFRLPNDVDPAAYAVKSLEAQYAGQAAEIGTQSVRLFVAFYLGLPFELTEDIYLPQDAVELLKVRANLTPERLAYLEAHTLQLEGSIPTELEVAPPIENVIAPTTVVPQGNQGTPVDGEHTQPERTITGQTTFQNLLDWGVQKEAIEQIIGETLPAPTTLIKDYYRAKGQEFSAGKTALQALVDDVK